MGFYTFNGKCTVATPSLHNYIISYRTPGSFLLEGKEKSTEVEDSFEHLLSFSHCLLYNQLTSLKSLDCTIWLYRTVTK